MAKSLLDDDRNSDLPEVFPEIKVPLEMCQSGCSATIIDTWYRRDLEADGSIEKELEKSDVVLLVYDISRPETIDRLGTYWLDLITSISSSPIVIVGNKVDLKTDSQNFSLEDIMRPLAKDYKQCEVILECSAQSNLNLSEVYSYAQKVVLYPTSPLYNSVTKEITQKFKKALMLIFRKCDKDRDFYLNDKEITQMHAEVFHTQLGEDDVDRIKEVVKQELANGVQAKGITLEGFIQLQKMMILRLKINVCWTMLRHYGYQDDLTLPLDFVLKKAPQQSVELSRQTLLFLAKVFDQYSEEKLLSFERFQEIFATLSGTPWEPNGTDLNAWREIFDMVPSNFEKLPLQSWLALWHMLTLQSYFSALKNLILIGCELAHNEIFLLTEEREIMEVNYRRVTCAFVIASKDTDESWAIRSFLDSHDSFAVKNKKIWACRVIEEASVAWECKYMVLVEFSDQDVDGISRAMAICDVAIIISGKQEICSEVVLPSTLPRLKLKSSEYLQDANIKEVFLQAFHYACRPFDGLDEGIKEKLLRNRKEKRNSILTVLGVLGTGISLIALVLYKKKVFKF